MNPDNGDGTLRPSQTGDRSMKANNWETHLSNDARKTLILALQHPDVHDVFKRSTLYISREGHKAVLHLNTTIRKSQVDSALIDLDWKKVEGPISAKIKTMGSVEIIRFAKVSGPKMVSKSKMVIDPSKKMENSEVSRPEPAHPSAASAPHTASAAMMYAEHRRLEQSLSFQMEEKKKISKQFLRVHAAFFDEPRCELVDSKLCEQMADRMVEDLDKTDRSFEELAIQVKQHKVMVEDLGHNATESSS